MSFKLIWSTSECTEGLIRYSNTVVAVWLDDNHEQLETAGKKRPQRGWNSWLCYPGQVQATESWWSRYKSKTSDNSFRVNWLAPPYLRESVVETAFYSTRARQVMKRADRWWMDGWMDRWGMWVITLREIENWEFHPFSETETLPVGEKMGGSWLEQKKNNKKTQCQLLSELYSFCEG